MENEWELSNNISVDFYSKGVCPVHICKTPHWSSICESWYTLEERYCTLCTVITYDDCCIMGMQITYDSKTVHILNVYLPYDDGSNHDEHMFYLGKLDSIVEGCLYLWCL